MLPWMNYWRKNPQSLIFDLRGNPGGWLNQAIGVADIFLDKWCCPDTAWQ